MMRLIKYIEHEFYKNQSLFTQAETNMIASMDFIDYVLRDENIIKLTDEEKKYVYQMYKSYDKMRILIDELRGELHEYMSAYFDYFDELNRQFEYDTTIEELNNDNIKSIFKKKRDS